MFEKIKKKPLSEKEIQGLIMKYLSSRKDIYFWRQNSGSFVQRAKTILTTLLNSLGIDPHIKARVQGGFHTGIGRYDCTSEKGLPDIIVIYKGRFVGFEVKNGSGRQRQTQLRAEAKIKQAGGFYFVVRSVEDVKRNLNEVEKIVSI